MNPPPFKLLVVNDEPYVFGSLVERLRDDVDHLATVDSADEAITEFEQEPFPFVILNLNLNAPPSELARFQQLLQSNPHTDVLRLSASATHSGVLEAECGESDGGRKPVDLNLVRYRVRQARCQHQLRNENLQLRQLIKSLTSTDVESITTVGSDAPPTPLAETMESCERWAIERALESHGGHREKTAKALGISVRSLHYKMARYSLR